MAVERGSDDNPVATDEDRARLVREGAKRDDVQLVEYADPWPVKGTRAEARARRQVLSWFAVSVLSGLAFVAVYVFWPWRYVPPGARGELLYQLYTPLLGLTLGSALVAMSFGMIVYTRRFLPHEVAVQERHDEPSSTVDQETTAAILADSASRTGLTRRSWMGRAVATGAGVVGLGTGALVAGSFVRDPWDRPRSPDSLWHTEWLPRNGEKVFLRRDIANPGEVVLTRPADLEPNSMVTVVPFRESDRGDREKLAEAVRRADSAVLLIRLRAEQAVVSRAGHERYHHGDFYAYSKLCTHLGCPVSLFETQAERLLCPCHQSQFDLTEGARPIFGPAARALPQLPITLDENGYFVATGDFSEPVGPSFWELGS